MKIKISQLKKADVAMVKDFNGLLSQLRSNRSEHTTPFSDIQTVIDDKNATLIVAQDGKKIIGMGTLYIFAKLGKKSGTVEDVVVDNDYRGQGLGKKIMQKIIASAETRKIATLYLTSRPDRIAGNKLYQKLGFKLKETNVYAMKFPKL